MRFPWSSSRAAANAWQRSSRVSAVRHGEKLVLMDLDREQFYSLDGVAGRLWELLDEPTSPEAVTDRLVIEYDAPREVIERDVLECLGQMRRDGLVRVGR